jgi:prepilin-type N-terminal cleavage/methylation domain-containing protein
MTKKYRTILKRGFTIVELVIVIMTIGIIAAITVVSYNSSQIRARNAKTAAAAEQFKEGFENYLTLYKQYPAVSNSSRYCLNIAVTSCVVASSAPPWTRNTATLEPELIKVMDTLPTPSLGPKTNTLTDPQLGYIPYIGGTTTPTLDGQNSPFLVYVLEGTTTCPVGPVATGTSGSLVLTSATPAAGRSYVTSNMTVCWIPLSKP